MKFIIPGGTGHIGQMLSRSLENSGHQVIVLSRKAAKKNEVQWDGKSLGAWVRELEGADVVLNLAGRTVNCRYTPENLKQMMDSRVDSTRAVGQALVRCERPPGLWLQMSTATIYAHRFDADNDEFTGLIGGDEADVPAYWKKSIDIARAWEEALAQAQTVGIRKVALRTAMVMSTEKGSVFDVLSTMVRLGFGGPIGNGRQYVSWIHEHDFVRAIEFISEHTELVDAVNVCSPQPLPQAEMMAIMRQELGVPAGLPATALMAEIGAVFLQTDTELILKSRRVVPTKLLNAGFKFSFPDFKAATHNLVARAKRKIL